MRNCDKGFQQNDLFLLTNIDIKSEYFYIILNGQVGFYIPKPKKAKDENKQQRNFSKMEKQRDNLFLVKIFKKGDSFGEISLIYDRGSDGSMFALEDNTICLLLNKQNFLQIIGDQEKNSITKEIEFLQHHPLFENWSFNLLRLLYFFSQIMNYNKNEVVYLEDTKPTHIYIIKQGEFAIYRNFKDQSKNLEKKQNSDYDEDDEDYTDKESNVNNKNSSNSNNNDNNLKMKFEKQKKYKLAVMGKGEIFGEEDILMKQNRTFSVVCDSYNGAQLIMIKRKVFKLSVMADIGSATFIKQRLKQKNYNHQQRLESINTFIKEYKDFFTENNEKRQNEQQNGNNNQQKYEGNNKNVKRKSSDASSNQNVYSNQGFLSPHFNNVKTEKGISLNFSSSYQNERKISFNSSNNQLDHPERLQNHQDLFDHFSQFQKKIYKTDKNDISSNDANNGQKDGSPLLNSQHSSQRNSILKMKSPYSQNIPKMPQSQDNSPEYSLFRNKNKDNSNKLSIHSLVTPKNFSSKIKMDQQNMQLSNMEMLAQSPQQKQINLLLEPSKQSSKDSLNSSTFSSLLDKNQGNKMQKSMSQQHLAAPEEILQKDRRVSNFYTESLVNQNNRIIKKQSSKNQRDSQSVDSKNSANQNDNQQNIQINSNSPNQQLEYYQFSPQFNQPNQYQTFSQPNTFYNLKGQIQQQDYLLNLQNPIQQESIETQQQNLVESGISNLKNSQQHQQHKLNQFASKFVLSDSATFSPNKYPLNFKLSSSTTADVVQNELTNSVINQQIQSLQLCNSIIGVDPAKKNDKKIHLQFLLNKQKPNSSKQNIISSSISATMPSFSSQTCVQICSFPKENLEFNHSMNTNINNYFSSNYKSQNNNQQSLQTSNFFQSQSQPQLKDDYFQQETDKAKTEKQKEQKTKKNKKQFRNSIFTDTFQKTFQQNLHHIQYRILQKKHQVKDIQQSIAKHIQDQTIKNFLEENSLVKSKYDQMRYKLQQQQQHQQQQQQTLPQKSEPKFEAIKQILKNNLHYSSQEIEQGLTSIQSLPRQKTANNIQKRPEFQYEEYLNQQTENNLKLSPNIKTLHEKTRSSFNSTFQNNPKSQQLHQQQYKFQQMNQPSFKQSLVLDIKQPDELEIKNFSITPNDKTGTVHIKSLQSLTSIPRKGQQSVFSFTKIPLNNEIKSIDSLKLQTENHSKRISLNEQNFNSMTNLNMKSNIKIKKNIQFNYKIPQKTSNS